MSDIAPRTPWAAKLVRDILHGERMEIVNRDGAVVATVPETDDPQVGERIARLMAASPGLLRACRIALDELRGHRLCSDDAIREALIDELIDAVAEAGER